MDYKIISFDLDGTLFGRDMDLSPENSAALNALAEQGVTVIANTGRAFGEMTKSMQEHPAVRYVVNSDGAVLYDKETDTRLWSACIPLARAAEIFDLLYSYRVNLCVHYHGNAYVDLDEHTEENYIAHRCPRGFRILYFSCVHPQPNFKEFLASREEFESIVVFFADDEEEAACIAKLRQMTDIFVVSSAPHNIEIVSRKAGKGHALHALCDCLGVDRAATIAVGDSINDIDHLRAAGLGLAMENAVPATKEAADAVICHHTEPVAKYILEHYIEK